MKFPSIYLHVVLEKKKFFPWSIWGVRMLSIPFSLIHHWLCWNLFLIISFPFGSWATLTSLSNFLRMITFTRRVYDYGVPLSHDSGLLLFSTWKLPLLFLRIKIHCINSNNLDTKKIARVQRIFSDEIFNLTTFDRS